MTNNTEQKNGNFLPEGFVYLGDINPEIMINLIYFNDFNFVGKGINGYENNVVILTQEAAEALNAAWEIFQKDGYNIVIYDAYRPQTAVDNFIAWSGDENYDNEMKKVFFPYIDHSDAFNFGYVAAKSSHTRGSTVDLTIIKKENEFKLLKDSELIEKTLNDGRKILYIDDGTLDMGSSVDLMDEASNSNSKLISDDAQKNREYFIKVMNDCGFENYPTEWWHFTLRDEPFPETYFNFDVK
jgi:D-alanyl-D-alanine dipeptidase